MLQGEHSISNSLLGLHPRLFIRPDQIYNGQAVNEFAVEFLYHWLNNIVNPQKLYTNSDILEKIAFDRL